MSLRGPTDETLPTVRRLIAEICAQYRSDWRRSDRCSIEDLVDPLAASERTAVLKALVALDVELREERGEHPKPAEYFKRFPIEASLISSAFPPQNSADETVESTFLWSGAEDDASFALGIDPELPAHTHPLLDRTRADELPKAPAQLGRYEVLQYLGEGGYGRVYLARDHALDRDVAIKVPKSKALSSPDRFETLLKEGRSTAALNHPSIVSVFDVGRSDDGTVFVVLEYVKGITLADLLKLERIKPVRLAECVADVADAVHHAHQAGLVHRDLKPSNIIIDRHGKPRITDFGLALAEASQTEKAGEIAGTPAYMAPEQVRGEAHRLDGRTDIWALGVILYQGLSGRMPFTGSSKRDLYDEILKREPKPPRQIDDAVPRELERICLKCLSKRMGDRFETALDLSQDLRQWQTAATGASVTERRHLLRVVPKGLRSFDERDAEFYLSLLPGPRDRFGLPESVRRWKGWCEARDAEGTRQVGVLYGPSGSGKSSLVRAGLLPLVNPCVRPVYVEASHNETEARLLAGLRRQWPELGSAPDLVTTAALLREGGGASGDYKTLIIIDQFEQWLNGEFCGHDGELVGALRHCDGNRLQALLLVRDDFWMATTRFFKAIDVPLVEGHNASAAEPLDPEHTRYVLAEFGRACGRVPDDQTLTATTSAFLEQASNALVGRDGGITPVHLSVFFEVVRKRPWIPATLRELGGIEGIGAQFIEDALGGGSTSPTHRLHRHAAHAVLRSMLSQSASELRGNARSVAELKREAGYEGRDADFAELVRILDNELRLITPVEVSTSPDEGSTTERRYQLTHDYLVEPLRLWLTKKQRETRKGRAELRLDGITKEWKVRHDARRLPSLFEWASIATLTRGHLWTEDERQMMRAATRRIAVRTAGVMFVLMTVGLAIFAVNEQERRESLFQRIARAEWQDVPHLLPEVEENWGWLRSRLEHLEAARGRDAANDPIRLILFRNQPSLARGAALRAALSDADPGKVEVIGDALARHPEAAGVEDLQRTVFNSLASSATRLRVASILSRLSPDVIQDRNLSESLAASLLEEDRRSIPLWVQRLGRSAPALERPLMETCRDPSTDPTMLAIAAETLGELLIQQGAEERFAHALVESRPEATAILRRELHRLPLSPRGRDVLYASLDDASAKGLSDDAAISQRANAAIAVAAVGDFDELWYRLGKNDEPQLRATLIDQLGTSGLEIPMLLERLGRRGINALERQALLLAFAETPHNRLTSQEAATLGTLAQDLYLRDPASAVHAGAELLLRRLNRPIDSPGDRRSVRNTSGETASRWTTGPNGHELVVLDAPLVFQMGSPDGEAGREASEILHHRSISRSIAVATKEVTIAQFKRFRSEYYAGVPDELPFAANNISWYDAIAYCNWLSGEAKIPRNEWCYPSDIQSGMEIDADAVQRSGYRLPTEAEWECFARAGTETSRHFGEREELLTRYGWTWLNSGDETHIVGDLLPNQLGLFDTLGNVWEWCHDGPMGDTYERPSYPSGTRDLPAPDNGHDETIRNSFSWRIIRGGAYNFTPSGARSAHRDVFRVENAAVNAGFRVVRTLPADD